MVVEADSVIGGRYALGRPLDRGGMGTVWVARDTASGTPVAVKFLSYSVASPALLRRFRREARALERLDHPHVVRMVGHGVEDSTPFIAMELLEGETLRSLIRQRGPLPPLEVLDIVSQAAAGLGAAHALGIVHRDIKPSNLFVCSASGEKAVIKVLDFGIASDLLEAESHSGTTGLIGSPAYMSPEQARAEKVDRLADIWSLSVVAFQLLTGREPFGGANVPETLQLVCSGRVPKASEMASGVPAGADEFFTRAFAPRRGARFQDLSELVAGLDAICRPAPNRAAVSVVPGPRAGRHSTTVSFDPDRRPRRWKVRALGVAFGASVAGTLFAARHWAEGSPRERAAAPLAASASSPQPQPQPQALPGTASEASEAPSGTASGTQAVAPTSSARPPEGSAKRPQSKASAKPRPAPSAAALSAAAPRTVDLDPVFGLPVVRADAPETKSLHGAPAGAAGPRVETGPGKRGQPQ